MLAALTSLGMYATTNEVLRVDFENGLPDGWTQEYVQLPVTQSGSPALYSWAVESGDALTYPTGCVSGTHRVKAANTTNQEMRFVTRLVSPPVNLSGVFRPQLVFWHAEPARASFSDTLRVYYRQNATDYWHLLPKAEYTRNGKWTEQVIGLISTNSTYQVAFEISESMGRGVVMDDIVFRSTPTCEDVSHIICSNIHAYDVTLSWDAFGAYNEFQVMVADAELDLQNIDQTHVVANLTENIYDPATVITGLQPETTYYVYVRSDCEENASGFTNWVSTSFRTLKVAYLPYTENFNNSIAIAGNVAYGIPDGWTMGNSMEDVTTPFVIRNNTLTNRAQYSIDTTAYLNFVGSMEMTSTPVPASEYVYAVSPQIVAESLQGMQVSFWLTAGEYVSLGVQNYGGELIIGTISDPLNFNTFHPLETVKIGANNLFKHVTVSLDNYTGTDKFIALASRSDMANAMFVDNFAMSIPDAPVPAEVKLKNIHSKGFTVQPSLHGATSWDVVVSTEYQRNGAVSAASVLAQQNNISAATYAVERADLANQIVFVYTRTHKNGATSAWSFAKELRVPGKMPVLTEETNYVESFEAGNSLVLNTLDVETRIAESFRGISSVYYPLQAVDANINTYPLCVSTLPNYRGSHAQLCGADSWFFLPEADSINTLKMVFRHASLDNLRGKISIGLMSDPYDLSSFDEVAVFEAEGKEYLRCLVSFDSYTGTGKYIAFRSLNAGSGLAASTNLIDEIIVSKLGRCREASNVQIDPHAEYANVTWNGGGMDGWIVGLSMQKNMLNTTYTTVTTPNITFSNLEPQKTYYCTIQTICGQDTLPLDDVRYMFRTPRGLPISEVFTGGVPSGWTQSNTQASLVFAGTEMTSSSNLWTVTNTTSYVHAPMSGFVAYRSLYQSSNKYGWLISPELYVDAAPDKPLELVFDLGMVTYSSSSNSYVYGEAGPNDVFMVAVSEDGGNTWLKKNSFVWDNKNMGNNDLNGLIWDGAERIRLDFTPYIGKRIKFAFYLEAMSSNHRDYLVIDNIILREGDERCGGLTNLTAYAPSVNTANVNWQLAGLNPWPAVVQLSASSAFATLIANDTIQGNTKSYSNLEPNTVYHVRARQLCANDAEWRKVSFRTPCTAVTPEAFGTETFDDEEALGCWAVGYMVENTSGTLPRCTNLDKYGGVLEIAKTSTDTTASDGAYAIMTELALDDAVKNIKHYQVVFRAGSHSNSADNVSRLSVGIVSDPTDVSYTWSKQAEINLQYAADSTELKTYVVSFENYNGDFDGNMGHYIMFYSEAGADSTNYILIDDVMVTDLDGCRMVIDLSVDSLSVDGARLHWSGVASQYELGVTDVRVNPDTCQHWLFHEIVTGKSVFVDNLEATTKHYAYIRAICDEESMSRWSSATYFQTKRGVPYLETFDGVTSSFTEVEYRGASLKFTGDSVVISSYSNSAWTPENVGASAGQYYSTIQGMEGKAAYINIYGTSCYKWLITPTFGLQNIGDKSVRLSAKVALCKWHSSDAPATATDDRLGVIISRNGGKTWYKRDATFWASDGTGNYPYTFNLTAQRIEVDLTDYVGDSITIAFYGESLVSNGDNSLFIDSVRLEKYVPTCMGVRHATLSMTDDTHAVAHWDIIGFPKEVAYEWSDTPDFASILLNDTTSADSLEFADMEYDHVYYLRLSQVGCTGTTVLSVSTPHVIPFNESFNTASVSSEWKVMQGNADAALAGTLPIERNTTQAWTISKSSNGLPANHLLGVLRNVTTQSEMWLVSPEVIIPAGSENVNLLFDLALTARNTTAAPSATAGQEFRVLVSGDHGKTWTAEWRFKDEAGAFMQLSAVPATGTRVQLPLNAFVGGSIRFAFYKAATANENELHIANVQIREVGEPCATPTDLQVSNISFTSATVTWNAQEDKVSVVEYSAYADFSVAKRDTLVNTLSHQLTDLVPGTTYYVRVHQICGRNSISDYTDVVPFMTLIGLPYVNPLSSLDKWTRYQSPIGDGLAGTRTLLTTTSGWRENSTASILGGQHIYCGSNSTNGYWIVSPAIDLSNQEAGTNIRLKIDLALTKAYNNNSKPTATDYATLNKFYIAVSTDNGNTYLAENAWEFSSNPNAAFVYADIPIGAGDTYLMDFSRFAGQTIRVALVSFATKAAAINAARFDLDVAGSTCFGLSGLTFGEADTAVVATIMPNDNARRWQIAYGERGTELADMRMIVVESTTAHIGGLHLSSTYDVYGRSICAEEDTSAWFGPYSFSTPIGLPYNAPFSASFDNWMRYTGDPDGVFAGTDSIQPATSGWTTYSSSSVALGMPHVYCSQGSAKANWLVSPAINLMPQDGTKGIWLSLRAALTSTYNGVYAPANVTGHTFRIAFSEDNGATWREDNSILWGDDTTKIDYPYSSIPAGSGKAIHVDMTQMAGKVVRLALIQGAAATGSSCIHIADLELAEYSVPCFGVENFTVEMEGNIAHCSINDQTTASMAWQYAYGASGFTPSDDNAITSPTKKFDINDMPMSSTFDIYVRSLCGAEDISAWVGPVTIQTPLGIPFHEALDGTSRPDGWESQTVSSGTWNVGSAKNDYVWGTNHAYFNIWSTNKARLVTPEIALVDMGADVELAFDMALTDYGNGNPIEGAIGQSFQVEVSTDGGETFEPLAVWGEADGDYEFASIPTGGERYHIDLSEYIGESVRISFYAIATVTGSDNDLHIRNVDIDTVSTASSGCAKIRKAEVLDRTLHSAKLIFRGKNLEEAMAYEYVCLPENSIFNPSLAVSTDTNVVEIKGLNSSNGYELFVRVQCADSTWSTWQGPFLFYTVECSTITGVTPLAVSTTEAVIRLDTENPGAALAYQAYLCPEGEPLMLREIQTFRSDTVQFVQPIAFSSIYHVYARKICEAGDTSVWCGPFEIQSPLGVPYYEPLSGASALPAGWTCVTLSSSGTWESSSRWSMSKDYLWGEKHAAINNYSTYNAMLISPEISTSGVNDNLLLSFDLALTHYNSTSAPTSTVNQTFEIRVSTDGGSTFDQPIAVWGDASADFQYADIPADGGHYTVNMARYAGQSIRVGFYAGSRGAASVGSNDNDLHLREIMLDTTSARCAGIKNVRAMDVTLQDAMIVFEYADGSTKGSALIEVALDKDFTQLMVQDSVIGDPQYLMTGLSLSTTYFVRVANVCDNGQSLWSSTMSFTTAYGVRYQEEFEVSKRFSEWTQSTTTTASAFADGHITESSSNYWSLKTNNEDVFPTQHITMNIYGTRTGWAITPTIDLSANAGQGLLLAFDLALCKWSGGGVPDVSAYQSFYVIVSEDGGETWQSKNKTSWTPNGVGGDYNYNDLGLAPLRYILDMTPYAGKSIKIGFCAEQTASGGDNNIMIDNIDFNTAVSVVYNDTICQYEDYDMHDLYYRADTLNLGENHFRIISENFDKVTSVNIFVKELPKFEVADTICEGELYTGHGFDGLVAMQSGPYSRYIERPSGCDSILTLNLTVIPSARTVVEDTLCDGSVYEFKGKTYYHDVILVDTLSSAITGCDSIVTYYITFRGGDAEETDVYAVICNGQRYRDGLFTETETGVYIETTSAANGCDSIVVLHLFVADAEGALHDTILASQLPYIYDGRELIPAEADKDDYSFSLESVNEGCEPTLYVHINRGSGLSNIVAESLQLAPNPVQVGETLHVLTDLASGEFTATVFNALGQEVYSISEFTTDLPGLPASGIYMVRIQSGKNLYEGKVLVK